MHNWRNIEPNTVQCLKGSNMKSPFQSGARVVTNNYPEAKIFEIVGVRQYVAKVVFYRKESGKTQLVGGYFPTDLLMRPSQEQLQNAKDRGDY